MLARIALQLHRNQMTQQRLEAEQAMKEKKEEAEEEAAAATVAASDNKEVTA